jgi:tetratricopeptide (TPR) repeat protein
MKKSSKIVKLSSKSEANQKVHIATLGERKKRVLIRVVLAVIVLLLALSVVWYLANNDGDGSGTEARLSDEEVVSASYEGINAQDYEAVEKSLEARLDEGIEDQEQRYQALANLGLTYVVQGQDEKALEYLLQAESIKEDETAGDILGVIARLYVKKGDNETAISYFKRAIARLRATPENADDGYIPNFEAQITHLGGTL